MFFAWHVLQLKAGHCTILATILTPSLWMSIVCTSLHVSMFRSPISTFIWPLAFVHPPLGLKFCDQLHKLMQVAHVFETCASLHSGFNQVPWILLTGSRAHQRTGVDFIVDACWQLMHFSRIDSRRLAQIVFCYARKDAWDECTQTGASVIWRYGD